MLIGSGSVIVEDFGMVGAWLSRLVVLLLIGVAVVSLPHGAVRGAVVLAALPSSS